eukprot:scaffold161645_cov59-Attheya_sp.AAC.3
MMRPAAWMDLHPFAPTLHKWENDVPIDCGEDWSREAIDLAIAKGPHASAMTPEARKLLLEDVAYQVDAGFSHIITWESIKSNPPTKVKVSPLALVPQINQRGRLILDLSFPGHRASQKGRRELEEVVQATVNNNTTAPLAPLWPVNELGKVLLRLLDFMRKVPEAEIINFAKMDLSYGLWRMIVPEVDCWHFAYVLLDAPGEPIYLLVCSHRNSEGFDPGAILEEADMLPPHAMESCMVPDHPIKRQWTSQNTWQMSGVFVDDFILAAVEDELGKLLLHTARAALHSIHGVFPPPRVSGYDGGKDPVSEKKLVKGDAWWVACKEILDFLLNEKTDHPTDRCKSHRDRHRDQQGAEEEESSSQAIPEARSCWGNYSMHLGFCRRPKPSSPL